MFSLPRDKSREIWTRKNELITDFGGQNETENNKISILLGCSENVKCRVRSAEKKI